MTGIRVGSPVLSVSGTTPVTAVVIPVLRKARLTKVVIYNADTIDHVVYVVYGKIDLSTMSFNEEGSAYPGIVVRAGQNVILDEKDIPALYVESTKDEVRAFAVKLGEAVSSNNVQVQIEIEEL